jgi:hypothetical protein
VAAATGLLVGVLLLWALVTPAFRGPDEPQHVSTAMRLAIGDGYPPFPTARIDDAVRAAGRWVGFPGLSRVFTDTVPLAPRPSDLADAPSLAELRVGDYDRDTELFDQMTQHAPAYYAYLAGGAVLLDLDSRSPAAVVLVLRLMSILLLVPVPWLIARSGLLMGLPPSLSAAGAFIPAGWIQFTHIGALVNNGTLLVLAASVLTWLLIPVVGGDVGLRRAGAIGAVLSVALLTKGFALGFVPLVALAYLAALRHARPAKSVRPWVVLAATSIPGLSWYAANLVRYGTPQPSSVLADDPTVEPGPFADWAVGFFDTFSDSTWAMLGWAETPLPTAIHASASLGLLALMGLGAWRLRRRGIEVLILLGTIALPLLIVLYGSWQAWGAFGQVTGAWGRYVFTGVVALAVLACAALVPVWRWAPAVPALVALPATAGLVFGLRHFWVPPFPSTPLTWWPAATALALGGVMAVGGGIVVGTVTLRRVSRGAIATVGTAT